MSSWPAARTRLTAAAVLMRQVLDMLKPVRHLLLANPVRTRKCRTLVPCGQAAQTAGQAFGFPPGAGPSGPRPDLTDWWSYGQRVVTYPLIALQAAITRCSCCAGDPTARSATMCQLPRLQASRRRAGAGLSGIDPDGARLGPTSTGRQSRLRTMRCRPGPPALAPGLLVRAWHV